MGPAELNGETTVPLKHAMKLLWTGVASACAGLLWINLQFSNMRTEVSNIRTEFPSKELFDAQMNNIVSGVRELKEEMRDTLGGSVAKIPKIDAEIQLLRRDMDLMRVWAVDLMNNHKAHPHADAATKTEISQLWAELERLKLGR